MIKLFRNIRKKLLQKNKITNPTLTAGRYLKYNIGEIVLVVIGILKSRPVRDEIWVETNKNEPIQRAVRYAILYNVPNGTLNQRIKYLLPR